MSWSSGVSDADADADADAETGSGLVSVPPIKMWQHPTKKIQAAERLSVVVSKAIAKKIRRGRTRLENFPT